MKLTGNELAALMYVAREVINVDGDVAEQEVKVFTAAFCKFGLTSEEVDTLNKVSRNYEPEKAVSILSNLGPQQKVFASALFTLLVAADGQLPDRELQLYTNLLKVCDLPYLTIDQALEVIK